jgi:phytol kinase
MNPWLGISAVLATLGALTAILRLFQGRVSPELSRKCVHIGMGFVCLSFPWIFPESWPVLMLAVLSLIALATVRVIPFLKRRAGSILGGVERQSWGEFYFPLAVAAVFLLARSDTLLYVIPLLTLTLADSVGALIGVRYGFTRYRTDEGLKSAEGSIAFFVAAFLSCHLPLLLMSETGRAETLLISLTAGFVVMLLEAISWRGLDNLLIPIGMFLLLKLYLPLEAQALLIRFLVILGLVVLVVLWRKRTTLSDSAVLAGALSGYALWAFGDWFWLLPSLLLFLVYVWLPSFPAETRPIQNQHAVTRVMAGGFLWLLLARVLDRSDFLVPYFLCMAAHTGNIITARLRVVRPHLSILRILVIGISIPTVLFVCLGLVGASFGAWPVLAVAQVPLAVAISSALFVPAWPMEHASKDRARIWLSETGIAVAASSIGLLK